MGNWEVDSIEVEEFEDRDFTVHLKRSLEAAKERKYKKALEAGKEALRLAEDIEKQMACHLNIVNILYQMEQYEICIKYIEANDLLKKCLEEKVGCSYSGSYLQMPFWYDWQDSLFCCYSTCCQRCGYSFDKMQVLVVALQGGITDSLQEAIDICNPKQYIYVISPSGKEIKAQCIIKNKDVDIYGIGQTILTIDKNDENIDVFYNETHPVVIEIDSSNVNLNGIEIWGERYYPDCYGIYIRGNSNVKIQNSKIHGKDTASVLVTGGNVIMNKVDIHYQIITYGMKSSINVELNDCNCQGYKAGVESNRILVGLNSNMQFNNMSLDRIHIISFCWGSEQEKRMLLNVYKGLSKATVQENKKKIVLNNCFRDHGRILIYDGNCIINKSECQYDYICAYNDTIISIDNCQLESGEIQAYNDAIININNCQMDTTRGFFSRRPDFYKKGNASIKKDNREIKDFKRGYYEEYCQERAVGSGNWKDIIEFLCNKEGWKDDSANFDLSSLDLLKFFDKE